MHLRKWQRHHRRKRRPGKRKNSGKIRSSSPPLAIMIAVAGYINYADSTLSTKEKADGTTADASTVLKDISSLDTDITDEVDAGTAGDSSRTVTETPGEAVLAGHLHTWPRPESTANRSVPRTKTL